MRKYDYWHKIIDVSEEYKKKQPQMKKGLLISHNRKVELGPVNMFDFKYGYCYYNAYTLQYVGRIKKELSSEEKIKLLKEMANRKKIKL